MIVAKCTRRALLGDLCWPFVDDGSELVGDELELDGDVLVGDELDAELTTICLFGVVA